jgi:hypothetical protein
MAITVTTLRRPTPIGGARWFVARELLAMGLLFTGYRQVRYLTRNHTDAATSNAHRIVDLERHLGMFTERWVQNLALHSRAVIGFLNRYYVTVHFPLTALFVVWVLVRHRNAFRHIRTWLYVVTAAALAIHVAFPLAPPRMLDEHRFVDTLQRYGPRIYSSDTTQSIANQFAAMPSLHFGWAVIVAAGFVAIRRTRGSLVAFAHPVITLVAIVATANHYWMDAVVALALIAATAFTIRPITNFLYGRPTKGLATLGDEPTRLRCEHPISVPRQAGISNGVHCERHDHFTHSQDHLDRPTLHGTGSRGTRRMLRPVSVRGRRRNCSSTP